MKTQPFSLGTTVTEEGINFSLYAPEATQVQLLLFSSENDTQPTNIELSITKNKTQDYWHIFIPELQEKQIYAYRINGNSSAFDFSKVLLDPYGKAIVGKHNRSLTQQYGVDNITECLKNVALSSIQFDWENTQNPSFPNSQNIIYEMHPSGFTKAENIPFSATFKAIEEKIPYLKKLGINTIELLPIFYFDVQDAPPNTTNYWGYSPISFFALHNAYSSKKKPIAVINEFKHLVKILHQNNIKIILDVVYNHTAESNQLGPNYSFKGIAHSTYYIVDEEEKYLDFTGCGNTLNTQNPITKQLIIDSLLYWKNEFHIDGFRFDLASVFARNESGNVDVTNSLLKELESHPEFEDTLLIAEPWDAQGLNFSEEFPAKNWHVWKDSFRDTLRKTVRGDKNMMQEFVHRFTSQYTQKHYLPYQNIHFITCHDGFTLMDLVSYNQKHNLENGENNQDGSSHNLSYNYGTEGKTDNKEINALRVQQIKNFMFCLFLSKGTPMILMGDEIGRTQQGNNNAYSSDNKTSWLDWNLLQQHEELFDFVQQLISIRTKYKTFVFPNHFSQKLDVGIPFYILHGTQLNSPDLSSESKSLTLEYVYTKENEHLLLLFNFHLEHKEFELPTGKWKPIISTQNYAAFGCSNKLIVEPRTCVLLEKM